MNGAVVLQRDLSEGAGLVHVVDRSPRYHHIPALCVAFRHGNTIGVLTLGLLRMLFCFRVLFFIHRIILTANDKVNTRVLFPPTVGDLLETLQVDLLGFHHFHQHRHQLRHHHRHHVVVMKIDFNPPSAQHEHHNHDDDD